MDGRRMVAAPGRTAATAWVLLASVALAVTVALWRPQAAVELHGGGRHPLREAPPPAAAEAPVLGLVPGGPAPAVQPSAGTEDAPAVRGSDWVDSVQIASDEAAASTLQMQAGMALPDAPVAAGIQVPPAGQAGLVMLLRSGTLKPASPAELDEWMRRHAAATREEPAGALDMHLRALPVYTIQGDMQFPADLTSAHAAAFILGERVPYPRGSPGHSLVLDMSSGSCIGTHCLALADE